MWSSNQRSRQKIFISLSINPENIHHIYVYFVLGCSGNPDAKRLYDDLLSNYNKLVRPVINVTDALTVKIKLKLSQLIDVVSIQFYLLLYDLIKSRFS